MQYDWWKTFFTGIALELWREVIPPQQTLAEAEFIRQQLHLPPQAKVLDVPCGHGRLALTLAARGYRVTGVDLAVEGLEMARQAAKEQNLAVQWEHRDMRDLPWEQAFDGAFCFGNSFAYMEDAANAAFLTAVCRALKPGGRFLLDYPLLAESFLPKFQERMWFPVGDIQFLIQHRYDPATSRVETEYTFIRKGHVDTRPGSHRIYTYRELSELLQAAGFGEIQAYGSLYQEAFKLGSPRPLFLARKPL
jgi:SAM-dependent methyltransferase